MKIAFAALTFALALPLLGGADVVQAAKEQKAKRKTSTTPVITNADVAKAKGKRVVDSGKEMTPLKPAPAAGTLERHEAARRAERLADEQIAAAERLVAALQVEVFLIEKRYFDESDPDRRDSEIVRRFEDASERLRHAVAALEALKPRPEEPPTE